MRLKIFLHSFAIFSFVMLFSPDAFSAPAKAKNSRIQTRFKASAKRVRAKKSAPARKFSAAKKPAPVRKSRVVKKPVPPRKTPVSSRSAGKKQPKQIAKHHQQEEARRRAAAALHLRQQEDARRRAEAEERGRVAKVAAERAQLVIAEAARHAEEAETARRIAAERVRVAAAEAHRRAEAERMRVEAERVRVAAAEAHRRAEAERMRVEAENHRIAEENRRRIEEEAAEQLRIQRDNAKVAATAPGLTHEARVPLLLDYVLVDNMRYNLPANPAAQATMKTLALEFFTADNTKVAVNPRLHAPTLELASELQFRDLCRQGASLLQKAGEILNIEQNFHLNRQEAGEFLSFKAELQPAEAFDLAPEKIFQIFQKIKDRRPGQSVDEWAVVKKVVSSILQNTLPLDHAEWPNFEALNPSFDRFVDNVILPLAARVRGEADIDAAIEAALEAKLTQTEQNFQATFNNKTLDYSEKLRVQQMNQRRLHGTKDPFDDGRLTFANLTDELTDYLLDQEAPALHQGVNERIHYHYLCNDPFLSVLKAPDQELATILSAISSQNQATEIQAIKASVYRNTPGDVRVTAFDTDFNASFAASYPGLGQDTDNNRVALARIKRLYNSVKNQTTEADAASIIYFFGANNSERCVDGKRDALRDLEKKYVYITGGNALNDPDLIIGTKLAKLFMDHRITTLRTTIDDLFPTGETKTYTHLRMHRALALGFGLPGQYEQLAYTFISGLTPQQFVKAYFEGGDISKEGKTHAVAKFSVQAMVDLVRSEVEKAMGGFFDDKTLTYMVSSNLPLRKAYAALQNFEAPNLYNEYFKQGASLRNAFTDKAIKKVLHHYNYISERDDQTGIWQ